MYSTFKDIFDQPRFIKALEGDVHIVADLPESLQSAPRARKHFTSWSSASYYEEMKELWKNQKVILQLNFQLIISSLVHQNYFFCFEINN